MNGWNHLLVEWHQWRGRLQRKGSDGRQTGFYNENFQKRPGGNIDHGKVNLLADELTDGTRR